MGNKSGDIRGCGWSGGGAESQDLEGADTLQEVFAFSVRFPLLTRIASRKQLKKCVFFFPPAKINAVRGRLAALGRVLEEKIGSEPGAAAGQASLCCCA